MMNLDIFNLKVPNLIININTYISMYYHQSKVLTPSLAIEKSKSEKLIFVSGTYDLLHFGHLTFLREAKKIDSNAKLLVTLHDDESIRLHKGENRPLMNIDERIELLTELDCVDYVVEWTGWENIVDFVLELKPKYMAITDKSYDHSAQGTWDGRSWDDIAKNNNIELVKIPVYKNYSSRHYAKLIE